MKKVLVFGSIHRKAEEYLATQDDLIFEVMSDPGAAIPLDALEGVDAVLIRYGVLTEAHLEGAGCLKVVSRHGVGTDNLPVSALTKRGVPVTIVGPVNAVSVAEQTMAMMLFLAKKVAAYDGAVREGNWKLRESLGTCELAGKTLLLLGFGRIGSLVTKRARAFDMRVLVHDPYVSAADVAEVGGESIRDWRGVLSEVAVLSLHLPLTPETRNIVDAEVLSAINPTALILNAARGGLVDEAALFEALSGRMASGGAGIDCFLEEPVSTDHPLLGLSNVVVSPHSAALTQEGAIGMGVVAARNVVAGLRGALDPVLVVNQSVLEKGAR